MARTSKDFVQHLTLICGLELEAGVIKCVRDTPSKSDACMKCDYIFLSGSERMAQTRESLQTDGDYTITHGRAYKNYKYIDICFENIFLHLS